MNPHSIRISNLAAEGPLQASKWLKSQVLLSGDEMTSLFKCLGPFYIYQTSCVHPRGQGEVTPQTFLDSYRHYGSTLERGEMPKEDSYSSLFSTVLTTTPDALYAVHVGENQQLIRLCRPVIQLQAHKMDYSPADGKFRSMTYGIESITWGIQFSFPQLFQENKTGEIKIVSGDEFPNTALFHTLQRWLRQHTAPVPFLVEGEKINVSMRLGKQCFSWINQHPQLEAKGLSIVT